MKFPFLTGKFEANPRLPKSGENVAFPFLTGKFEAYLP